MTRAVVRTKVCDTCKGWGTETPGSEDECEICLGEAVTCVCGSGRCIFEGVCVSQVAVVWCRGEGFYGQLCRHGHPSRRLSDGRTLCPDCSLFESQLSCMGRDPLGFGELRRANFERCELHYHRVNAWSPNDWLGAVTGELGELAGVLKNTRRAQVERVQNGHAIVAQDEKADVGREAADVVIYLDLLCARLGIDLGAAVRAKFNEVSRDRLGSRIVLEAP